MGSTDGLALQLLYVAAMGETLTGLLLREASPSSILPWEEVSTSGVGASDLWDGDMTASAVAAFPVAECSDSWLESSAIAQVSKSWTSVARLILGFKGVLGEVAAGTVCALPSGRVVHSVSSGGMYRNIDPHVRVLSCSNTGTTM